jgi:hypothetical protein
MTTTRFLTGVLLVVLTAGSAVAQYESNAYLTPRQISELIPSVAPYGQDPVVPLGSMGQMDPYGPPGTLMPPGRPVAATALDRLNAPIRPVAGENPLPLPTMTGQPDPSAPAAVFPKGSYPNPYDGDGPGCCGPLERDGLIGYEVYLDTGPTIPFGAGDFAHRLELGWMVGGGGRSLFFNTAHDAAWVADLGFSYQYNRGNQWSATNLNVRQATTTNPTTGAIVNQPDILTSVIVRDIDRTDFNFAFGRDWWLWGQGATGFENDWNLRIGGLVGGRWGTAHVDEVPVSNPFGYFRRQDVTHGLFLEVHANVEVPLGAVIFFSGVQLQWGYDWTNLAPPFAGDIQNVNVLLTAGIRF